MDYSFICFCCAVLHNACRCCCAYLFVIFSFFTLGNFSFQLFLKLQMKLKWMLGNFAICFSAHWKILDKLRPNDMEKMKFYLVNFGIQQFRHRVYDEWRRFKSNISWTECNFNRWFFSFFFIKYLCTQWIRRKHLSG